MPDTPSEKRKTPNPEKIKLSVEKNSNSARGGFFKNLKTLGPHKMSYLETSVFIFLKKLFLAEFEFFSTGCVKRKLSKNSP